MRKVLAWMLVFVCITLVTHADNYFSITQFSDGTSAFNATGNLTKYINLPPNATYINATVTIKGLWTNTTYTYQETANSSAYSGWTDGAKLIDGNYSSAAYPTADTTLTFLYVNYTKPWYVVNDSRWQVKSYKLTGYLHNLTLNSTCMAGKNVVELRVGSYRNGFDGYVIFYCRNSTDGWYEMNRTTTDGLQYYFYEEGIWWQDNSSYPEDVKVTLNTTLEFNHAGALTGTNTSVDINTSLGTYATYNTTIKFVIGASDWGMVEISNLVINYEDVWNCDGRAGEVVAFNFTLTDEDNFTTLTGDIAADLEYQDNILSFENQDVQSLAICIGGSSNYSINGTIYGDVGYVHKYYLTDTMFTPVTQEINLYNFGDSTGESTLQWTLRDYTWAKYSGIIGKLQRYYPQNHTWLTVQQDRTDEFGRTVYHIKEETDEYRMYWYDHNILIDSTDTIKFVCSGSLCTVESQALEASAVQLDIRPTYSFNNVSKMLTVSWNDATGSTSYVNITVTKETGSSRTIICDTTVHTAAGSYDCNTTGYSGSVWLDVYAAASPEGVQLMDLVQIQPLPKLSDALDFADANFWTFGFTLVIVSLGIIGSPISILVMLVVALFVQSMLGLTSVINLGFVVGAAIVGIVIALKVRQ